MAKKLKTNVPQMGWGGQNENGRESSPGTHYKLKNSKTCTKTEEKGAEKWEGKGSTE